MILPHFARIFLRKNVPEINSNKTKHIMMKPKETVPADSGTSESGTKKWARRIAKIIVAGLLVVILCVMFLLGPIAKFALNIAGKSSLGVDKCHVEKLWIFPFWGTVIIEDFVIGKPAGTQGKNFSRDLLALKALDVDVSVCSLLFQKKIIEHLIVKDLDFNYEKPLVGDGNLDLILKKLLDGLDVGELEKDETLPDDEPIFIGARYVNIDAIRLSVSRAGMHVPMPPITIKFEDGIGIESNLTPAEFGALFAANFMNIFNRVNPSAIGGAVSDAAGTTVDAVSGAAGAIADGVSDLFGSDDEDDEDDD